MSTSPSGDDDGTVSDTEADMITPMDMEQSAIDLSQPAMSCQFGSAKKAAREARELIAKMDKQTTVLKVSLPITMNLKTRLKDAANVAECVL